MAAVRIDSAALQQRTGQLFTMREGREFQYLIASGRALSMSDKDMKIDISLLSIATWFHSNTLRAYLRAVVVERLGKWVALREFYTGGRRHFDSWRWL